ncbi:MAG TPA: DUF5916 domain-containing protein [Thermoanaerobaculia bacterium]|nr:DUF5916 domain-containing protein [Thermoanaerobaculia bacterium]
MSRLAVALLAVRLFAATPPPPPPLTVHRAAGPISVDGDLSDAGWKDAAKIDQFYETSPGDNTPPKVQTTAWITYDDRYFYIGVRCDDPHPEKIRAPYVERDNVIGTDDNIAIFLDTRNDRRTALELRVNPRGIQADGIFNDANGSEDFSPDFFYDTGAKIDDRGWSAEYRIPFSSLRYDDAPSQTWNILIWRNYPREFRYAFQSAPIARDSNCSICHAHPLVGLENLPKSGHLIAAPYVTGQSLSTPANDETKSDAGIDVKWTPSQNQAVDLTLNPDFSQVESDVAQITVNQRFAVFFPEKRPFFLEGFDLFDTPVQVAYTRTINEPRWGARSTGRILGSAYTLLVTGDDGGGLTIIPGPQGSSFAPQDFKSTDAIARIRHDLGASFIGGVFTDREIRGGGHNRVIGPDFQWRPNDSDAVTGEVLYSDNTDPDVYGGASATSHAAVLTWNRVKRNYDAALEARDLGDGFRADLGFVPQVGYREIDGSIGRRYFPEHSKYFSFVRPSIFVDQQYDTDGNTIFRRISPGINVQGVKNLQAFAAVRHEDIRVGSRLLQQTYLVWQTQFDPSRRFPRIVFNGTAGPAIDFTNAREGRGASLQLSATLRPIDNLTFDPLVSREWLDVNGQRQYTATVERLKTVYSFSAKSLVRVIGQYVKTDSASLSGSFTGSVLYSYKLNWQTVLFLGYGDDRELTPFNRLEKLDRSFFLKVSYAIQR